MKYGKIVRIWKHTKETGGCTFDRSGNILDLSSGYVVSPFPQDTKILRKSPNAEWSGSWVTSQIARYFVRKVDFATGANAMFGTWLDGDCLHLDVVIVCERLEDAIDFAVTHNQLAIYDIRNQRDIRITRTES